MTKREKLAKSQIVDKLLEGGYKTYAELFDLFELHLTTRPGVVGYMLPSMAEIWISEYLDIEQVSLVVRHEILHEYYEHMKRYKAMFKEGGVPKNDPFMNVAADYEISNVGYTEQDKIDAKKIKIGGKEVEGLVTSIDRPDLADKTFEEIYEALKKESPESMKQPAIGNRGDQQLEQAERAKARAEALKEQAEEMGGESGESGQSSGNGQKGESESGSGSDSDQEDDSSSSQGSGDQSEGEDDSPDGGDSNSGDEEGEGKDKEEGKKKSRQKYDDDEYKNMTPEEKKKERARRRKEAAKKLKEQADKLINEINEVVDGIKDGKGDPSGGPGGPGGDNSDSEVFETPEEQKARAEAVKRINEKLSDLESAARAKDEATSAILKEVAVKASRDSNKYRNSPLTRFTESLNRFIKDETARARNSSWAHINKKYVNSGLLRPGASYSARGDVPLINVYFDQSGSWDAKKIETGKQAIATLIKYQTRGEIKVNLYYFDTKVSSSDSGLGGGTNGQPIINHIKQTKPNNVIILTDGDIKDIHESITIPGAVWILFYPEVYGSKPGVVIGSPNLVQHLKGRQLTRVFAIGKEVDLAPGITANGWSGKGE